MGCRGRKEGNLIRITLLGAAAGAFLLVGLPAGAGIKGVCSNCHTMHNSQGSIPVTFDDSPDPNSSLLKGDCLGCHAQGGAQAKVNLGADSMPQVLHTEATDLAGGNFAYITGAKGSGASDTKGHNIAALTGTDSIISHGVPGGIVQSFHDDGTTINTNLLTCAGTNGCHGYRYTATSDGIGGAHHNNEGGQLNLANSKGNSYRFLIGVKGYESPDWEYNATASNHNEYFALTEPVQLTCSSSAGCHVGPEGSVAPPDGTISQFCATCHGNFHTVATTTSDGIGETGESPFIRHPTDLVLPSDADREYASYNGGSGYSLEAPVARTSVPATSSSTFTAGSDAVMCLSCHRAHASDYPDMLRWDYDQMIAGGGGADGTGCFVCHTTKD